MSARYLERPWSGQRFHLVQSDAPSTVAKRLSAASPGAPAWSDAEIGLSTLNSQVHYWGEPSDGQAIVAGRPPFTAPNGVSDAYDILDWPGKALWDRTKEDWWYSGYPTGNQIPASPTIVRYRPSDDRFAHWQGRASMTGGIWPPYGHAHSFDAADLDVVSRRIWRHLGPSNANPVYNFALGWFNIDTYQAGTVPGDIAFMDNWPTVSLLPESRLLYVVRPQSGGSQNIRRFHIDRMEWVEPLAGPTGDCGPSIYSGGKVFVATLDRNFYAITADGSIERRANTPIIMDRSGSTTHAILCGLKGYIYAFCGDGDIWRYDPRTDSWGGSPYHSIPWRWPYRKYVAGSSWGYVAKTTVGAVPTEDVALVCVGAAWDPEGSTQTRAFIWKPECGLSKRGML